MDDSNERELNWSVEEIDPDVLASQELEVSLWGDDITDCTRWERAVIVIRTEAEHPHFERFRSSKERRIPDYQDYKIRLGHALVREIEHLLPGLRKAILVMDVATPLTFEDQGGRSGGAVAGWSWDYEDFRGQPAQGNDSNTSQGTLYGRLPGLFSALHGRCSDGDGKWKTGRQGSVRGSRALLKRS